jgi:hypothetical protein
LDILIFLLILLLLLAVFGGIFVAKALWLIILIVLAVALVAGFGRHWK